MDFFGFHPLYVVLLLALALIIFGPSRLPKMGAQMGRMLREFQAAREGLTQQMRDAFEEEPENDFSASTTSDEEEPEPEPEPDGPAVAVLDPPPDGQATPEAQGTAVDAASDEVSLGDQAAAGLTAALQTPVEGDEETVDAAPPEKHDTAVEPEAAAGLGTPGEEARAGEAGASASTVSSAPTAEEASAGRGQPHWDGTRWEYPAQDLSPEGASRTAAEEPQAETPGGGAAGAQAETAAEPGLAETHQDGVSAAQPQEPAAGPEAPVAAEAAENAAGSVTGDEEREAPALDGGDPLAPVAAHHHDAGTQPHD